MPGTLILPLVLVLTPFLCSKRLLPLQCELACIIAKFLCFAGASMILVLEFTYNISAFVNKSHMGPSLTQNPDVLDLYTKR
jgi:hypothetical protein